MHKIVLLSSLWYLSSECLTQLSYCTSELPVLLLAQGVGMFPLTRNLPGLRLSAGLRHQKRDLLDMVEGSLESYETFYEVGLVCVCRTLKQGVLRYVAKLHRSLAETWLIACEAAPLITRLCASNRRNSSSTVSFTSPLKTELEMSFRFAPSSWRRGGWDLFYSCDTQLLAEMTCAGGRTLRKELCAASINCWVPSVWTCCKPLRVEGNVDTLYMI